MLDLLSTAVIAAYTWVGKIGVVGWWKNHVAIQQANYQIEQQKIKAAYFLCEKEKRCDDLESWAKPGAKPLKVVIPISPAASSTTSTVSTPPMEVSP
jgi:hypothetical protein